MADSTFRVGGLASGLDTNTIVDKLVAIEAQPITANNTRQSALTVQISAIGSLISKIKALATSGDTLGKSGVAATSAISTPSGVSAATGTGALPGRYGIIVSSVASAAKARSTGFASTNNTVAGGTLALSVKGTAYNISITAGSDLGAVVSKINQSGAPVSAAIVSNGSQYFVALTNRETGKPIGSAPNGGMSITSDSTGLAMAVTQDAVNASVTVDGDLVVESQSNEITNAIPGVTLTVKAQQLVSGDLVIARDSSRSTANVQAFVDAYNDIVTTLKTSLRPDPKAGPNPGTNLDGSLVLALQRQLQSLSSTQVVATGTFRTLTDIGVKMGSDGKLTLDQTKLAAALSSDATAVDAVFSTASTGLAAKTAALSKTYTDSLDGQLIQRQTSLQKTIKDLAVSNDKLQQHVDSFKQQLIRRFSTMESLIGGYNTIGTFINNSPVMNPLKGESLMSAAAHQRYAAVRNTTASKERLMVMLFEAAMRHMRTAARHLETKDRAAAAPLLDKASQIVLELQGTLKPEVAPKLVADLIEIYTFTAARLTRAIATGNPADVREAERAFAPVADGFAQAVNRAAAEQAAAGAAKP